MYSLVRAPGSFMGYRVAILVLPLAIQWGIGAVLGLSLRYPVVIVVVRGRWRLPYCWVPCASRVCLWSSHGLPWAMPMLCSGYATG